MAFIGLFIHIQHLNFVQYSEINHTIFIICSAKDSKSPGIAFSFKTGCLASSKSILIDLYTYTVLSSYTSYLLLNTAHKQDQKEKKEAAADRKRKQVAAASTSAASDVTDMVTDNALLNTADGEGEGGGGEGGGGGGDDVCLVTDEQMEVENGSAAEPLSVS